MSSFPSSMPLQLLRLVANLPPDAAIMHHDLPGQSGHTIACLQFVVDKGWVHGIPVKSNGDDEGFIAIRGARLSPRGRQYLAEAGTA